MAPMVLLLNASKVAGVVGAITVAANALAFRHFQHKNLAPFPDPVDETQDVLASFPIDKEGESSTQSEQLFLFPAPSLRALCLSRPTFIGTPARLLLRHLGIPKAS
jgi:hypothetical protein